MGQNNCICSLKESKGAAFEGTSGDADGVERIFDTEGNLIDTVMPGLEGILSHINPD